MNISKHIKINRAYEIIKREMDTLLQPETSKPDDTDKGINIYPYLKVSICDNLILQDALLKTNIDTLSEDIIYNNITFIHENSEIINEQVKNFWENNQEELCDQYKDYISYGFGASEVLFDESETPVELVQIPAKTLHITKRIIDNKTYYYAVQTINGKPDVTLKLSHLEYPEEDDDLPVCFWLGGGRTSDFFDYPLWLPAFNHVSANVNLNILDAKKLADGNLMSGILVVKKPPAIQNEAGDDTITETLDDKMTDAGSGLLTLELTSLNADIPLEVQYIQISESNFEYLNELAEKSDKKIMAIFKIPEARLLMDVGTESMNSHKTDKLYQIYTIELANKQKPLEKKINKFNLCYFDFDAKSDIETPVFADTKETETQTLVLLFDKGLITLGQAINRINTLLPELMLDEVDLNNPVYNSRYYNGNPLGLTDSNKENNPITNIGELIDVAKINEVFSKESND